MASSRDVKVTKFKSPMETAKNVGKVHGCGGSSHGPTAVPKEQVYGQKTMKPGKK